MESYSRFREIISVSAVFSLLTLLFAIRAFIRCVNETNGEISKKKKRNVFKKILLILWKLLLFISWLPTKIKNYFTRCKPFILYGFFLLISMSNVSFKRQFVKETE